MQLREARPDDAPAIAAVAREAWRTAYTDIIGEEQVAALLDRWYGIDDLRDRLADAPAFVVAEVDGEVVGFADGVEREEEEWALGRLYVHPDHWNRGVGSALIEAVETRAREAGAEAMELGVFAENDRATGFYERHGYEEVGEIEDGLEEEVTELRYRKPLRR
ncbi:GNAT family N-acetyltransferase [Natronomonas sp. EA1]|uniref:GNAT family N-acetyltransferase n=1 Tax=Natronomonas sp. EA1 TaxID=3421655 RepID=UPI003EB9FA80